MVWQPLQRSDGWLTTWPLLGHQADGYSDIERRDIDYRRRFAERLETFAKRLAAAIADGGDQDGVKVDDPDSTAWDKPPTSASEHMTDEAKQYAKFCDNFRMRGSNIALVLAALQKHDPRWTRAGIERVVTAWKGTVPGIGAPK